MVPPSFAPCRLSTGGRLVLRDNGRTRPARVRPSPSRAAAGSGRWPASLLRPVEGYSSRSSPSRESTTRARGGQRLRSSVTRRPPSGALDGGGVRARRSPRRCRTRGVDRPEHELAGRPQAQAHLVDAIDRGERLPEPGDRPEAAEALHHHLRRGRALRRGLGRGSRAGRRLGAAANRGGFGLYRRLGLLRWRAGRRLGGASPQPPDRRSRPARGAPARRLLVRGDRLPRLLDGWGRCGCWGCRHQLGRAPRSRPTDRRVSAAEAWSSPLPRRRPGRRCR